MNIGNITVTLKCTETEPDGSACAGCGDPVYLKAWRYIMFVNATRQEVPVSNLICDSCKDLLE